MVQIIKNSLNLLFSKPLVMFYSLLMLIVQIVFGSIFIKINESLISSSDVIKSVWVIFYTLILILTISFFIVLMIRELNKIKRENLVSSALKNFGIIIFTIIVYVAIFFVSNWIAYLIGKSISLSLDYARVLFFLIMFGAIISILLFISLSSFFLIKDNLSIKKSIVSSIKFVKSNYILVLYIFVFFFVLIELSNMLSNLYLSIFSYAEIINYVLIYPLLASFLVNIINNQKN